MRTSREVYDRIRWDPRFEPTRFVIGYESRLPAPREVAYTAFVPDGDIPWHRVLYFREGDAIVWDRRTKLDALEAAAQRAPDAARTTPLAAGEFFRPLPLYRFDARATQWLAVEAVAAEPARAVPSGGAVDLTLATFNVLCDAFEAEVSRPAKRLPALLAALRALDADVVAIQEATPAFVRALLAERWVREAFALSDGPEARTVDPQGVLVLTRLPVAQLVVHQYSRAKRAVVAEVRAGGAALRVAAVHLTSDHTPNAPTARRVQLEELVAALGAGGVAAPPLVVLGDFNQDDDELAARMAAHGFRDAWTAARPGDPGLTFDTRTNALARAMSRTGRASRLDRVYLRDGAWTLSPAHAALFADTPIERSDPPLFPSDHFGLVVHAHGAARGPHTTAADEGAAEVTTAPTHHTAVVIIPPAACWGPIQAVRREHDRHAARWMPHITLLYGFVPEAEFDRARAVVARVLGDLAPFEITLEGVDTFEHRQSRTAWTRPVSTPAGALAALQGALERAFPQCDEQSGHGPAGFTPHLSLAQLDPRDPGADARLAAWRAAWRPVRFAVREVALISRRGEEPFAVRATVPLRAMVHPPGPDEPLARWLDSLTPAGDRTAQRAAEAHLRDACIAALPGDLGAGALHLTGAVALGVAEPSGDLDAVALGPVSREEFFAGAREWLAAAGFAVRAVTDAVSPVLRGVVAGVPVDLGYAQSPAGMMSVDPAEFTAADMARLDRASQVALGAVRDAACVRARVAAHGAARAFTLALRALKRWARARGLYSNAFGYLSGFGWTVLAAWACTPGEDDDHTDATLVLERALAALASGEPVALTPEAAGYSPRARDALVLASPTAPVRNVARNATRATAGVLRAEAAAGRDRVRAIRRAGGTAWDGLLEAYDPRAAGGDALVLTVACDDPAERARCAGWLEGHVLGLILDLENAGATKLRPDPRGTHDGAAVRYTVALGEGAVEPAVRAACAAFEAAFAQWEARPAAATLGSELRAGG